MSNLRLPSMAYDDLLKLTEKTGEKWQRIAYETWVRRDPGSPDTVVALRHYKSEIAYVTPHRVILNTRGYDTKTTAYRMNAILYPNAHMHVGLTKGSIVASNPKTGVKFELEGECIFMRD